MNPLWQIKAISGWGVLAPAQRKAGVKGEGCGEGG